MKQLATKVGNYILFVIYVRVCVQCLSLFHKNIVNIGCDSGSLHHFLLYMYYITFCYVCLCVRMFTPIIYKNIRKIGYESVLYNHIIIYITDSVGLFIDICDGEFVSCIIVQPLSYPFSIPITSYKYNKILHIGKYFTIFSCFCKFDEYLLAKAVNIIMYC